MVSGGTDNHLFLLDLIGRDITGKDADAALGQAHITVNKNAVPNDPRSPFVTSGLRIGTPASTTRGFKEAEVTDVANWIADILDDNCSEAAVHAHTRQGGRDLPQVPGVRAGALTRAGAGCFFVVCIVPSATTRKRRSSIRGWRAKDSRFAAAANV